MEVLPDDKDFIVLGSEPGDTTNIFKITEYSCDVFESRKVLGKQLVISISAKTISAQKDLRMSVPERHYSSISL